MIINKNGVFSPGGLKMIQGIKKNRPSFQEISKLTPFHGWVFVRNKTEIIGMCGHSWK